MKELIKCMFKKKMQNCRGEKERWQGLLSVDIHSVHMLLVTVSDCIKKKKKKKKKIRMSMMQPHRLSNLQRCWC